MKDGKAHTYWRLVRSVRVGRKVVQQTVAQLGELDAEGRAQARALARTMLQLGDDAESTERQLHLVGVPPPIASAALRWARAEPMGA